jgi:4-amino-4-deoxy-L-arabinose transferase-like glycosyltransferase
MQDVCRRPVGRTPGALVRRDLGIALVLGWAAAVAVLLTVRDVGLTWDEPTYFQAASAMRRHLGLLAAGGAFAPGRDPRNLRDGWLYEYPGNLHPPMGGYLLNLSWWAFSPRAPAVWAYRASSALLFGGLVGVLYWWAARTWGRVAGLVAAAALVLMPRIFGHAHIAATETPSMFFWFLVGLAAQRIGLVGQVGRVGQVRLGQSLILGLALGLSLLVKFTNWLVVMPLAAMMWRFRGRRGWPALALADLTALLVAAALNPGWWHDPPNPAVHLAAFLKSSLTRDPAMSVPTYFLGRTYASALPWYNGPVLTLVTTPAAILLLFFIGIAAEVRSRLRTQLGFFAVATVALFWVVRALPGVPGHGGTRLFLPMFPCVAALAGAGAAALVRRRPRPVGAAALALLVLSAGVQLVRHHPHDLAYYSEIVGGPSGARRLGFETTYWWDAANEPVLDLLNRDLPPNACVYAIPECPTLVYWQNEHRLRRDLRFVWGDAPRERIDFVLLLCRQAELHPPPNGARPGTFPAEVVRGWYDTWQEQWRAVTTRDGTPLLVLVRRAALDEREKRACSSASSAIRTTT